MTLTESIESYLTVKRALGSVFSAEARILRSFGRTLGDVPLDSIDRQTVHVFCRSIGLPTRWWERKHQTLRGFFTYLVTLCERARENAELGTRRQAGLARGRRPTGVRISGEARCLGPQGRCSPPKGRPRGGENDHMFFAPSEFVTEFRPRRTTVGPAVEVGMGARRLSPPSPRNAAWSGIR